VGIRTNLERGRSEGTAIRKQHEERWTCSGKLQLGVMEKDLRNVLTGRIHDILGSLSGTNEERDAVLLG
jgi:hypothetical protein